MSKHKKIEITHLNLSELARQLNVPSSTIHNVTSGFRAGHNIRNLIETIAVKTKRVIQHEIEKR